MAYEYMLGFLLYRMIGGIRMMALHLGVLNGEIGMMDRTQDRLHDVSAKISCPADSGGGLCTQLCIYAFGDVQIVVYDVGGCHMSVVTNPDRDQLSLWLCMDFYDIFSVFSRLSIECNNTRVCCTWMLSLRRCLAGHPE